MAKLVTLQATYRIVTPMFLGGANQDPSDGIRPPSVKGALRFWWRALNWWRFRNADTDDAAALRELHKEEARLFGAAANDDGEGGQGCFHLRVSEETNNASPPNAGDGHKYMLGRGLIGANGTYLRKAISTGTFTVKLLFRPKTG
ncbi:MAG: type III-B CRISPR module RAMP protein Cmr1, partial [Gammaproteobacteria bacterium]